LEKDMNGLRELLSHFSKEKQNIQYQIQLFTRNCENYRQILTEIELEQIYLQKKIVNHLNMI
jgi:hypothetical protein